MSSPMAGARSVPLQTRAAPIAQANTADRTIQVIWTTGAAAPRRGLPSLGITEVYDEVLLVTDAAVDLSRLRAGAAVLDSHQTGTVGAQRAVVEDAWLQAGKGYANIRFPKAGIDLDSDRLLGLARDGIIRNISVGYSLNRVRVVEPTKANERLQVIVEHWTPYELSFVTVPADTGAQVLTGSKRLFPVQIVGNRGTLSTIEVAALRLRMGLRQDARRAKTWSDQFDTELRARAIDPYSEAAHRARIAAFRAHDAWMAQRPRC